MSRTTCLIVGTFLASRTKSIVPTLLFELVRTVNENRRSVSWDFVSADPNSVDISMVNIVRLYPTSALPTFMLTLHPYLLRYGVYLFPPDDIPKR
jgi:hypothetical protein